MNTTALETTPKSGYRDVLSIARLPKRSDFLRIAAQKRRWAAPGLVLQVAPRPNDVNLVDGNIRVGFTATRKVGNAVIRNRSRRRLRAAVDRVITRFARADCDYVVIVRAATAQRAFDKLVSDLEVALKKCDAFLPGHKGSVE
ncbi:MAG: ribonuclease P protein component [Alphaproteobacteria bacterium]|jgi:ribonuclease P protein component|nr:ribonuclease P protein component [Alphaproteobacteria bacterium]